MCFSRRQKKIRKLESSRQVGEKIHKYFSISPIWSKIITINVDSYSLRRAPS
nr:MAG TPA: hypothetical protein [Bacteriophage sp.]